MSIKGIVKETSTNDWGFTSYVVSGHKYGSEVKGGPLAKAGDLVEFDGYDKPSKDGSRAFPTIRKGTLRVLPAESATVADLAVKSAPMAVTKDVYWANKESTDKGKEPKIAYFAALDRAIAAVSLYVAQGAVPIPTKAADKLAALQGAIDLETSRFFHNSNNALEVVSNEPQEAPVAAKVAKAKKVVVEEVVEEATDWES